MKIVRRVWDVITAALVPTRRPEEKTVMKLKHWQEVNKDGKLHKQVVFPVVGQVKKDGVYALILVQGRDVFVFNRTGREMVNVESIIEDFKQALVPQGVYIGELCNKWCSLEVLSGIVNPNRTAALSPDQVTHARNMHLYLHDYMMRDEFIVGQTATKYMQRYTFLTTNLRQCPLLKASILPVWKLYDELQVEGFAKQCIADGEEGAVFKCNTIWEAGHKGWRMMKWVREVSYDLLCVGIEEGTGKYAGKAANLLFRWEGGKQIKAMLGKGYTHADAENMFVGTRMGIAEMTPIDKVYRVRGLSDSSKGVIRLPKVMEERHDKTEGDF
ncbi:DNA ligase [Pseudomonas phage uligo]|uniref:DNA ligase n=1 Tax=Pseudomonas phage uligo TaxID=2048979 RepID=A0A2H4P7M2_9CAUD|nr:DNA ligase [Pseudomonas phage uligo]ATW58184.1 DNA ligase [Pseudomonas phage uligo]